MFIRQKTKIKIKNSPKNIWEYAHDPNNWTASNPQEHFGLKFDSPDNRPHTGVTFHQDESVAGIRANLTGQIMLADRPNTLVWTGLAEYKVLFLKFRLHEGGLLTIKSQGKYSTMRHDVFIQFSNSLGGKMLYWIFMNVFKGDSAVYDHTYRELRYFKKKLEAQV